MILLREASSTEIVCTVRADLVFSSVSDKVISVHGSWTLIWEFLAVMIEPASAFTTKWMV